MWGTISDASHPALVALLSWQRWHVTDDELIETEGRSSLAQNLDPLHQQFDRKGRVDTNDTKPDEVRHPRDTEGT
jgi:hypothetical protein